MDFILFHAVFACSPLLHRDTKMFRKQGQEDEKKPSEFRIVIGNIRGPCFYFKVAIKSSTQIMSDNYLIIVTAENFFQKLFDLSSLHSSYGTFFLQ